MTGLHFCVKVGAWDRDKKGRKKEYVVGFGEWATSKTKIKIQCLITRSLPGQLTS